MRLVSREVAIDSMAKTLSSNVRATCNKTITMRNHESGPVYELVGVRNSPPDVVGFERLVVRYGNPGRDPYPIGSPPGRFADRQVGC
jgi:hypothetical protein